MNRNVVKANCVFYINHENMLAYVIQINKRQYIVLKIFYEERVGYLSMSKRLTYNT